MLGGGFKYFLYVHLYLGEMIHLDEHIFQMRWLNHQLKDNMNVHKHLKWIFVCRLSPEGLFHADPHPGNMLRTPDGRSGG